MSTQSPSSSTSPVFSTTRRSWLVCRADDFPVACSVFPPVYVVSMLGLRRPITISRFLCSTWVGSTTLAVVTGTSKYALQGMRKDTDVITYDPAERSSAMQILGASVAAALFWRRVPRVDRTHILLGGAVLGEGVRFNFDVMQRFFIPSLSGGGGVVRGEEKEE